MGQENDGRRRERYASGGAEPSRALTLAGCAGGPYLGTPPSGRLVELSGEWPARPGKASSFAIGGRR